MLARVQGVLSEGRSLPYQPSLKRSVVSPLRSNTSSASSGVQTTGSPCRLNEVFSNAPIPVRRSNAWIRS